MQIEPHQTGQGPTTTPFQLRDAEETSGKCEPMQLLRLGRNASSPDWPRAEPSHKTSRWTHYGASRGYTQNHHSIIKHKTEDASRIISKSCNSKNQLETKLET